MVCIICNTDVNRCKHAVRTDEVIAREIAVDDHAEWLLDIAKMTSNDRPEWMTWEQADEVGLPF